MGEIIDFDNPYTFPIALSEWGKGFENMYLVGLVWKALVNGGKLNISYKICI